MDEMILDIFSKIKPILNIEGASIALHDPAKHEFYFIRTAGECAAIKNPGNSNLRFPDDKGVAGWVMAQGCAAVINDVSSDNRFFGGMDEKGGFSTRSMICVPLQTRKGFLGVLYALNKLDGKFTEREEKILGFLSGTIAVSLENARLYGELKDHLDTLARENQILLSQMQAEFGFKEIIGSSPPMRRMFELIGKVIDSPTTVLIQGETGTGKELVAKVIHFNGPLKNKPFVAENCAALPENLLESELFGHVRGAFTGAVTNKKGLFELADGGTIFLDEIGEMSPLMQVKLLRVLQEGQFRPVGGSQTRQVKVRVIAATNRNLEDEVSKGNFREDLYYRINVFQITPPPLRERKEDIPFLAHHFLEKYAGKNGKPCPHIAPQAIDFLTRFNWPGNVRELENEMERALTMAGRCRTISVEFLSDKIKRLSDGPAGDNTQGKSESLKDAIQRIESHRIRETLAASGGNRSKAAKILGLSRQGLLNKIAAYKIPLIDVSDADKA
jgi:transcriptional regulator with GAF, ATPase, and Fis domain